MKLTKGDKDIIARNAMHMTTAGREKALAKAEHALALEIRDAALGKNKRAYLALPKEFQRRDSWLYVNFGGKRYTLNLASYQPLPRDSLAVTGELRTKLEKHISAKESLREDKNKIRSAAMSVLASVNTAAQLAERWPEGKPYYASLIEPKASGKGMVSVAALNQAIEKARAVA